MTRVEKIRKSLSELYARAKCCGRDFKIMGEDIVIALWDYSVDQIADFDSEIASKLSILESLDKNRLLSLRLLKERCDELHEKEMI